MWLSIHRPALLLMKSSVLLECMHTQARPPVGELLAWQRFNHFPEARQLTRKDLLAKHLAKYQVCDAMKHSTNTWPGTRCVVQ